MKMNLIQPFINSMDAVIAETMGCTAQIADVTMEEGNYERTGIAARVSMTGDIQGRIILDGEPLFDAHQDDAKHRNEGEEKFQATGSPN